MDRHHSDKRLQATRLGNVCLVATVRCHVRERKGSIFLAFYVLQRRHLNNDFDSSLAGYGIMEFHCLAQESQKVCTIALDFNIIRLAMRDSAKVSMSGALQRSTGVSNIGEAGFRL